MERLEKCELLKSKGYTYDKETGKIYGFFGNEIKRLNDRGYISLTNNLRGHHFAWYMTYGNVDFIELDHINTIRDDNRICNLRISNRTQQSQNRTKVKGYTYHKQHNKFMARIKIDGITKHLGLFDTEEEARQTYLEAKQKYHLITK